MKKTTLKVVTVIALIITTGSIYIFNYVPPIPKQHGIIDTKLYLGNSKNQPLLVAFGGGDGGNDWTRNYLKTKRDSLIQKGYAVLAIGYFKSKGTPKNLDRISLNAISDSILKIVKHPKIDATKIALIGGSKGGELVLNLASRFEYFKAVIALSTSNVSFPAITWSSNTSSWYYNNKEVKYVPASLDIIGPALKGDLHTAFSIMLENEEAAENAEIIVENINGPILVLSGKNDTQWPATIMSNRLIERLDENNFKFYYEHLALNGGHIEPLNQFNLVYEFLEKHFPVN